MTLKLIMDKKNHDNYSNTFNIISHHLKIKTKLTLQENH